MKKIDHLIEEAIAFFENENWSKSVTKHEKWHAPEGTFEKSAEEIAKIISQDKKVSLKKAMARLNFFLNRGGSNVPSDTRARVNKAKDILRKMYA